MQQPRKRKEQVGVPRRFGIGTLMILVTAFAVLFSLLKVLHAPPTVFAGISIFVAVVAACQVLLFKGKKPTQGVICGRGRHVRRSPHRRNSGNPLE